MRSVFLSRLVLFVALAAVLSAAGLLAYRHRTLRRAVRYAKLRRRRRERRLLKDAEPDPGSTLDSPEVALVQLPRQILCLIVA